MLCQVKFYNKKAQERIKKDKIVKLGVKKGWPFWGFFNLFKWDNQKMKGGVR